MLYWRKCVCQLPLLWKELWLVARALCFSDLCIECFFSHLFCVLVTKQLPKLSPNLVDVGREVHVEPLVPKVRPG